MNSTEAKVKESFNTYGIFSENKQPSNCVSLKENYDNLGELLMGETNL